MAAQIQAARIVNNFVTNVVAERLKAPLPEPVDLLGNTDERLFPSRLSLVDGPAIIRAHVMGKWKHHDGGQAVLDRAIDDDRRLLAPHVVQQP